VRSGRAIWEHSRLLPSCNAISTKDHMEFRLEFDTTYSNPRCECMRTVAMSNPSIIGLSEPAAKGAMVIGIRNTDPTLHIQVLYQHGCSQYVFSPMDLCSPLGTPMVTAMAWIRFRYFHRIVYCSFNLLRQRWKDGADGRGLEGGTLGADRNCSKCWQCPPKQHRSQCRRHCGSQ
jgi:hypothetical protein